MTILSFSGPRRDGMEAADQRWRLRQHLHQLQARATRAPQRCPCPILAQINPQWVRHVHITTYTRHFGGHDFPARTTIFPYYSKACVILIQQQQYCRGSCIEFSILLFLYVNVIQVKIQNLPENVNPHETKVDLTNKADSLYSFVIDNFCVNEISHQLIIMAP